MFYNCIFAQQWTTYQKGISVQAIAIDKENNKWFCTGTGVLKFDGKTWTNFTTKDGLIYNYIRAIAIDKKGNKWFGAGKKIQKFDDKNWVTYTIKDSLVNNSITCMAIDDEDNKWIGTNAGISKFDEKNWFSIKNLPNNEVSSIAIDKKGNKWFGTKNGYSVQYNDTTFTIYQKPVNSFLPSSIEPIVVDKENNKWLGMYTIAYKFDDKVWSSYSYLDGLAKSPLTCMAVDNENNKWFGTYGAGVSKFDGINWTTYTTADGLVSDFVFSIAADAEGNIWFGTKNGISKFTEKSVTTNDLFSNEKFTIYPNPANTSISFQNTEEISEISIFDLQGKLCEKDIVFQGNYDISSLLPGIYIVKAQTGNGVKIAKFLKI